MDVSIVIPAYNEGKNIEPLLKEIKETFPEYELVVAADGSTDNTEEISRRYADVVLNGPKEGKGAALNHAFKNTKGELIVMLDADLSHSPKIINKMINFFNEPGVGMVIASRRLGSSEDHTPLRDVGNALLTFFGNIFLSTKLTDILNGFKVFKKDILGETGLKTKGFNVEIELIGKTLKNGYKIKEIADHEFKRAHGKSNLHSFRDGMKILIQILKERKGLKKN